MVLFNTIEMILQENNTTKIQLKKWYKNPAGQHYKKIILDLFKDSGYQLSFEPGRSLIAEAGVLITKVIRNKKTKDKHFIKFIPDFRALWLDNWIDGPSAIGSEKGIPISIKSTPFCGNCCIKLRELSKSGSPAVKNIPRAFLLFFLSWLKVSYT